MAEPAVPRSARSSRPSASGTAGLGLRTQRLNDPICLNIIKIIELRWQQWRRVYKREERYGARSSQPPSPPWVAPVARAASIGLLHRLLKSLDDSQGARVEMQQGNPLPRYFDASCEVALPAAALHRLEQTTLIQRLV